MKQKYTTTQLQNRLDRANHQLAAATPDSLNWHRCCKAVADAQIAVDLDRIDRVIRAIEAQDSISGWWA